MCPASHAMMVPGKSACSTPGVCGDRSTHAIGIVVPFFIAPKSLWKNAGNASPLRASVITRLAHPSPGRFEAAM